MKSIILKVLGTLGILFLLFFPCLKVFINYEKSIWEYLFYILVIALFIVLIIKIWKNVKNKKINTCILILIFLMILDMIYYERISMKTEPLIYLHNKYNVSYSDMEIVKTEQSSNPIIGIFQPREASIKIENIYVNTYYASYYTSEPQGWKDDYNISKQIANVLNKYTNNYIYSKEYDWHSYNILMNKNESYKMSDIIKELNTLFTRLCLTGDYSYDIYFVDEERYQRIINKKSYTSLTEIISDYNNYKNIDVYYDKDEFLSTKVLSAKQNINIEDKKYDGYQFVYYSGLDSVDIIGYVYDE